MKTPILAFSLLFSFICLNAHFDNSNRKSPQEILDLITQEKIAYVDFAFSDMLGTCKSVTIPACHVSRALEQGLNFDGSSVPGCTQIFESDMLLKPDLSTFHTLSFTNDNTKTARILCDVHVNEQTPHAADPRHILKTVLQEARDLGYEFLVGPELEFFIFQQNDSGTLEPCDKRKYFANETNIEFHRFQRELLTALQNNTVPVEKIHHEVAPGQYEIVLRYADALTIADRLITTKETIKSVCQQNGLFATFMPKPVFGENGSAMHIHFSLFDTAHNRNAFYSEENPAMLSDTAQKFIAGILKHMSELAILFNPTINSYKRLVPGYEAPIYMCWGTKNRSAMIRVPRVNADEAYAVRAELRSPDPSCNPYLAFAALLKAGLEGIKNDYTLPAAVENNVYHMDADAIKAHSIFSLPTSLQEALNNFLNGELSRKLVGDSLVNELVKNKKEELKSFSTTVTEWELQKYF